MIFCLSRRYFMTNDNRYQKHLTLQDRFDIEDGLNHGYTLKKIADKVGKDNSTIAKEIRKHRIGDEGYNTHSNDCMYRFTARSSLRVLTAIG
jgi:transposase, IS30 family